MRKYIILLGILIILSLSGCGDKEAKMRDSADVTGSDAALANNDTTEESPAVEEVHGRIPASMQYDPEIMTYDPEDTIYYKTYYDDFVEGKIMHIDYHPHMEIREELEDYFVDDSEIFYLDYLVSMFYDDRTIETDEKELEQLFWEHGYIIYFHSAEYQDFHLRFIEIAEKEGLSLYPIRILIQTWDDDYIYLQDITGPIPRKIKELMVVDRDGVWQLIVHSSGFSREYIPEEELSFWEFTGSYWILVPMELEIDTSHAYTMGNLYPDIDRDELFEAIYYRDGIAFRPSIQPSGRHETEDTYRLGIMEITKENKKFRLVAVVDALGITSTVYSPYIEFTIKADNEKQPVEQTGAATPVQMQEITVPKRDYLLAEVPELWDIACYIHQKTAGQACLIVDRIWKPDNQAIYHGRELPGYYDRIYASVAWPDHEETVIWFYVGKYEGQILCREDNEEELYTLEEWRAGDGYAAGMDAVFEWQQEKAKILLASEGEGLDEPWYEAYKSVIMDWTIIKDFEDGGWVEHLINDHALYSYSDFYEFYSYWLCDIDRNGTPELFLWYPGERPLGDIMVILTYTDHPMVVYESSESEKIYGINVETGEIIIDGHRYTMGPGGTENEWSGYKLQGDAAEFSFLIDSYADMIDNLYFVNYPERHGAEWQKDGREYEEIYENHVANCIPVEEIVMYDMMDLSGLKDIQ